jgi:L1 cell adhesion molecule like protein
LSQSINPDEAVAYGATVLAALMSKVDVSDQISRLVLNDVIPLSLGVQVVGGVMSKVVRRNSTIPIQKTAIYANSEDNQVRATFKIFEGERTMVKDNFQLGYFILNGITPSPRGKAAMNVTFTVDTNGILHVSAMENTTGNRKGVKICYDAVGRHTHNEILRKVSDSI